MTDLPIDAVEALVRWRCDQCGDVWRVNPGPLVRVHVRPNGLYCEGGPVSRIAAVPDGVYVVNDGQVTYRTLEPWRLDLPEWFFALSPDVPPPPHKDAAKAFHMGARAMLAALLADG